MENEIKQLRNTKQRKLVFDTVYASHDHPVADTIYERARVMDKTISKGTVYRNLNLLAELGEITRVSLPMGPDHFDFNCAQHYHFLCRSCNCVHDANIPYDAKLDMSVFGMENYRIEGHNLVLLGLCPECLKKQENL